MSTASTPIQPTALDHVALWVAERDRFAAFVVGHLGMHEIERTDRFTLLGADARRGKLTLFDAEGPRETGPLARIVLRVSDLDAALSALPEHVGVERLSPELAVFTGPEGIELGLTTAGPPTVEYDLDHVLLRVPDPPRALEALAGLGFARDGDRLTVEDKHVRLEPGPPAEGERPLLNHLALLVDSATAVHTEVTRRGLAVADFVDAPNTRAVFVWGPDGIKLEYVEHKPSFSLV